MSQRGRRTNSRSAILGWGRVRVSSDNLRLSQYKRSKSTVRGPWKECSAGRPSFCSMDWRHPAVRAGRGRLSVRWRRSKSAGSHSDNRQARSRKFSNRGTGRVRREVQKEIAWLREGSSVGHPGWIRVRFRLSSQKENFRGRELTQSRKAAERWKGEADHPEDLFPICCNFFSSASLRLCVKFHSGSHPSAEAENILHIVESRGTRAGPLGRAECALRECVPAGGFVR